VLFTYSSKGRRELPNAQVLLDGPVEPLEGRIVPRPPRLHAPARRRRADQRLQLPDVGRAGEVRTRVPRGRPDDREARDPDRVRRRGVGADPRRLGLLPDGSLQLVSGSLPGMFDLLRLGDTVGFTGSASTAAGLRAQTADGVRFTSETDSINASVLGPDATPDPEFDAYVKQLIELTTKAGQKCTAIRRAIVPAPLVEPLVAALQAKIAERVVIGDPHAESVTMGRSSRPRSATRCCARSPLQAAGGELLMGSTTRRPWCADGSRAAPEGVRRAMLVGFADTTEPPCTRSRRSAGLERARVLDRRRGRRARRARRGSLVTSVATQGSRVATELLTASRRTTAACCS
jgi:oxepin-CoA hydrolase/3-oxo-5,6-dehydrosuberyl-CoA semialdehyde dehydrogenase